jgi:hypothetical protein
MLLKPYALVFKCEFAEYANLQLMTAVHLTVDYVSLQVVVDGWTRIRLVRGTAADAAIANAASKQARKEALERASGFSEVRWGCSACQPTENNPLKVLLIQVE